MRAGLPQRAWTAVLVLLALAVPGCFAGLGCGPPPTTASARWHDPALYHALANRTDATMARAATGLPVLLPDGLELARLEWSSDTDAEFMLEAPGTVTARWWTAPEAAVRAGAVAFLGNLTSLSPDAREQAVRALANGMQDPGGARHATTHVDPSMLRLEPALARLERQPFTHEPGHQMRFANGYLGGGAQLRAVVHADVATWTDGTARLVADRLGANEAHEAPYDRDLGLDASVAKWLRASGLPANVAGAEEIGPRC